MDITKDTIESKVGLAEYLKSIKVVVEERRLLWLPRFNADL